MLPPPPQVPKQGGIGKLGRVRLRLVSTLVAFAIFLCMDTGTVRAANLYEKVSQKYAPQLQKLSMGDAAVDPWTGGLSESHVVEVLGWGTPGETTRMLRGLAMRRRLDRGFDWTELGISLRRYLMEPISGGIRPGRGEFPPDFRPFADDGKNRVVAGFLPSENGAWWVLQFDRMTRRLVWVSESIGQYAEDQARWHLYELERRGAIRKGVPNVALSKKALVIAVFMKTMDLPYPLPSGTSQKFRAGKLLAQGPNREITALLVELMERLP